MSVRLVGSRPGQVLVKLGIHGFLTTPSALHDSAVMRNGGIPDSIALRLVIRIHLLTKHLDQVCALRNLIVAMLLVALQILFHWPLVSQSYFIGIAKIGYI